jgi:hypothetical protein
MVQVVRMVRVVRLVRVVQVQEETVMEPGERGCNATLCIDLLLEPQMGNLAASKGMESNLSGRPKFAVERKKERHFHVVFSVMYTTRLT